MTLQDLATCLEPCDVVMVTSSSWWVKGSCPFCWSEASEGDIAFLCTTGSLSSVPMARELCLDYYPMALYHGTARGNAQMAIVLDDGDRQHCLPVLGHEILQRHWR